MWAHRYLFPVPVGILILAALIPAKFVAADSPSSNSDSERRVQVAPGNADEINIKTQLSTVAEMASARNLEGYLECFAANACRKIRKDAAITFVRHEVSMEVLDSQILKHSDFRSELAVRYRATLSDQIFDVVSLVAMKREDGYWKISAEKVQEFQIDGPTICTPSRYACMGGACVRIQ